MYCDVEWSDELNSWKCKNCGRTYDSPKDTKVFAQCRPKPSIVRQAVNYTKAIVQHIATGSQTRTDEEVNSLLEICEQCEHYNKDGKYCRICGCRCNANKSAFTNKLRMKSQSCPKGKWS